MVMQMEEILEMETIMVAAIILEIKTAIKTVLMLEMIMAIKMASTMVQATEIMEEIIKGTTIII